VYERQHYLKNRYIQPSLNNGDGINITNYVMDGYFVLLPDIVYEVGSPGDSALDCVSAAVQEVQKLGIVDLARIGLTGHSLGGYETTYIIAKSKLFAVAVGGASQTDLVSCYLTVGEAYKRPEFWRFEDYTNRMGKMLFEDMDNYIYNSPVFNASTITTPLLLWTGDKDGIVAPKQSMELYLALRRLGKKVALLRYRDEYHSLSDSRKQVDLTLKIADWFNYYLKDGSPKLWMEANANP
jgi:dipeptidyl aminopeptidase/acylaminoacyl peptidase